MGALTIAFDTTIVGALALTWVVILIHLFFQQDERQFSRLFDRISASKLQAVAGILLFAAAYTLGSAVSRMAQDFFNDDDLRIPNILRMAVTEDRIIASVYCDADQNHLLEAAASTPALTGKICDFQCLRSSCCTPGTNRQAQTGIAPTANKNASLSSQPPCCQDDAPGQEPANTAAAAAPASTQLPPCLCKEIISPRGRHVYDKQYRKKEGELIDAAHDVFGLQENALLMKGEDPTLRLRQLHDQIMVLRGATLNGLLAFVFCLYAWGARLRSEKPRSVARWLLALVPIFILFLSGAAITDHYGRDDPGPPYMEFSLLIIGGAGLVLLWFPRLQRSEPDAAHKAPGIRWRWPVFALVFAVLVTGGVMGWWATEVLYGQQVIYSYDSLAAASATSK